MNVWVIRADKSIASEVESKSLVAVGWPEMGDVSGLRTLQEFRDKYRNTYTATEAQVMAGAGQMYRFANDLAKGDLVLTPLSTSGEILIGEVAGHYIFDPNVLSAHYPNVRSVRWLGRVSKFVMSPSLRASVGSIMTVFSVTKHLPEVRLLQEMQK